MENLDIDIDLNKINSDNNNSKNNNNKEEDDILSCFNKAYCLTGEAKIKGICEYITYLIDNSCKFLIFAHHTIVLDAIEEQVQKCKIDYIRIDGKVPLLKRQENVNKFQQDENVLVAILGITACATGLTLTKASTVVFAELHFTPTVMIQAEDRVHRIGQDNECVNIHYLVGSETLDDLIFQKLNSKHTVVTKTLDNQQKNLDLEKANKVGDFIPGDYAKKQLEINERSSVVLSSGKNKTLNDFVVVKKEDLDIHNMKLKRGRDEYDKMFGNKSGGNKNYNSKTKENEELSSNKNLSKNEESMREILSKNQNILNEIENNNNNNYEKNKNNNKENKPKKNKNNFNENDSFEINNLNDDDIFNLFKI
jgi:SWI/SNF-related matrix-associated actin-dependent regulator 1 of chromatin subfamily A